MKITQIELCNIRSYVDISIPFKDGMTYILGQNGTGKSTILMSIGCALFGDNERYERLLRKNAKSGKITVHFEIEGHEKSYAIVRVIERTFSSKGEHFSGDEWYITTSDNLSEGCKKAIAEKSYEVNEWLQKNLNIGNEMPLKELFNNIIGVSQGELISAFLLPKNKKKDIFDPLFNLKVYKEYANKLKGAQDLFKEKIDEYKSSINTLTGRIEELLPYENRLNLEHEILGSLTTDLKNLEKELEEISNRLSFLKGLNSSIKEKENRKNEIKTCLQDKIRIKSIIEEKLNKGINLKEFLDLNKENYNYILELVDTLKKLEEKVKLKRELEGEIEKIKNSVNQNLAILNEKLRRYNEDLEKNKKDEILILEKISLLEKDYKEIKLNLEDITNKIKVIEEIKEKIKENEKNLSELENSYTKIKIELENLNENISKAEFAYQKYISLKPKKEEFELRKKKIEELQGLKKEESSYFKKRSEIIKKLERCKTKLEELIKKENEYKEANKLLEKLTPLVAKQEDLENEIKNIEREIAVEKEYIRQKNRLIKEMDKITNLIKEIDKELDIERIEKGKDIQIRKELLKKEEEKGREEKSIIESEIKIIEKNINDFKENFCPLVKSKCPILKEGENFFNIFVHELEELKIKLTSSNLKLNKIKEDINLLEKEEEYLQLADKKLGEKRILQESYESINKEINEKEEILKEIVQKKDRLNKLKDELLTLSNPKKDYEIAKSEVAKGDRIKEEIFEIEKEGKVYEEEFDKCEKEAKKFQDIDKIIEEERKIIEENKLEFLTKECVIAQSNSKDLEKYLKEKQKKDEIKNKIEKDKFEIEYNIKELHNNFNEKEYNELNNLHKSLLEKKIKTESELNLCKKEREKIKEKFNILEKELHHIKNIEEIIFKDNTLLISKEELYKSYNDIEKEFENKLKEAEEKKEFAEEYRRKEKEFLDLGGNLEKIKLEFENINSEISKLEEEQTTITTILSEMYKNYSEEEYIKLENEEKEKNSKKDYLLANIKNQEEKLRELEGKVELLEKLRLEKDEKEKLLKDNSWGEKLINFLRNRVFKEAGPLIVAQNLRKISSQASKIYQMIRKTQNEIIEWQESYEVKIKRAGGETLLIEDLSGGEQMAVALSIRLALLTILTNLRIGFFDEPTNNLDVEKRISLASNLANFDMRGFDQLFVISHEEAFSSASQNVIYLKKDDEDKTIWGVN